VSIAFAHYSITNHNTSLASLRIANEWHEQFLYLKSISAIRVFEKSGRIEQLFTVQFHPKPIQLFKISNAYHHQFLDTQGRDCVSVRKKMCLSLSAVLLLTIILTLLDVFILGHWLWPTKYR